MNVERVTIVVHEGKPDALRKRHELTAYLEKRGATVDTGDPDLVLSLGGDGTMLRAAAVAHAADAPLVGVNLGTLGYLTEVDAGEEERALDAIFDGNYAIEERMMLACDAQATGGERESLVGLNEVLVERAGTHRLVRLGVRIGGESLAAFNADGLLVATPTGSTAYALSAGGPLVSPRADCLILVPVAAHMIFARPFVLAPDETVEIIVAGDGQEAALSIDGGAGFVIAPGSTVNVRRHERSLRLIKLGGPGFLERLRIKLDLPG